MARALGAINKSLKVVPPSIVEQAIALMMDELGHIGHTRKYARQLGVSERALRRALGLRYEECTPAVAEEKKHRSIQRAAIAKARKRARERERYSGLRPGQHMQRTLHIDVPAHVLADRDRRMQRRYESTDPNVTLLGDPA